MEKISGSVLQLSCHKKGTHPIQTLVETLKTEDEISMFLGILDCLELAKNPYGTFVMQKVVDFFPEEMLEPVFLVCKENFIKMATCNNGLPIIKKALAKFKTWKRDFIDIIENNTMSLAQHHFGNYAVQVAIENWEEDD